MENNQWSRLGDDFLDAVDSAITTGNFMDISRTLGDFVNTAIDAAKMNINTHTPPRENRNRPRPAAQSAAPLSPRTYTRHPAGKGMGIVLLVLGIILSVVAGISLLVFAAISTVYMLIAPIVIFGILAALGILLIVSGVQKISFVNRFLTYTRNLGERLYIQVQELAGLTQKNIPFTLRDLNKMIQKKLFFEAHLDAEGGYLILSDQAYAEYQTAKRAQTARQRELEQLKHDSRISEECRKMIEEGQNYVTRIRTSNEQIPDPGFSAKLDKMEQVVRRIFDVVRAHPEVAPDLQKMMDYYLPTTAKLLDAYRELDAQPVSGEHITATKKEIETAVDTLNTAFEKLLDSLFADRAWDISSDISVLNTVLAQDGLTKDDFSDKTPRQA